MCFLDFIRSYNVKAALGIDIYNSNIQYTFNILAMDKIRAVTESYRQFLLEKQFATEKTAGYMQKWVEQFLHFACDYRGEVLRTLSLSVHRIKARRSPAGFFCPAIRMRAAASRPCLTSMGGLR